jgi:hypothetical protein
MVYAGSTDTAEEVLRMKLSWRLGAGENDGRERPKILGLKAVT